MSILSNDPSFIGSKHIKYGHHQVINSIYMNYINSQIKINAL